MNDHPNIAATSHGRRRSIALVAAGLVGGISLTGAAWLLVDHFGWPSISSHTARVTVSNQLSCTAYLSIDQISELRAKHGSIVRVEPAASAEARLYGAMSEQELNTTRIILTAYDDGGMVYWSRGFDAREAAALGEVAIIAPPSGGLTLPVPIYKHELEEARP